MKMKVKMKANICLTTDDKYGEIKIFRTLVGEHVSSKPRCESSGVCYFGM